MENKGPSENIEYVDFFRTNYWSGKTSLVLLFGSQSQSHPHPGAEASGSLASRVQVWAKGLGLGSGRVQTGVKRGASSWVWPREGREVDFRI